jgi:NAD(P)-dependent dehydrogenase (short-subunit alcohol dehydrogenase family)
MDIAIVTGAGSGLGLAITRKLIELGLRVYGLGGQYDESRFDHEYFVPMPCNMGDMDEVRDKVAEIIKREGDNIFVLVNNAKLYHHKSLAEISDAELEAVLKVNLLCPVIITRMALPSLTRLGGFVINIVANTAENSRGGAMGAATAGGLRWMGEALFEQLREDGVKVCNVFPQTNKWRPDGTAPAQQRPQSAIDTDAVAEAVGSIVLNRFNNVITDLVIRPQRLAEKPVPAPFNVPYPKPQPLPKTAPREAEEHITMAETRAEMRIESALMKQLREREEAGIDDEDEATQTARNDERRNRNSLPLHDDERRSGAGDDVARPDDDDDDDDERDVDGDSDERPFHEDDDGSDDNNSAQEPSTDEQQSGDDPQPAEPRADVREGAAGTEEGDRNSHRRRRGRRGGRNRHGPGTGLAPLPGQQNFRDNPDRGPRRDDDRPQQLRDDRADKPERESVPQRDAQPRERPAREAKPLMGDERPGETREERDARFERETRPTRHEDPNGDEFRSEELKREEFRRPERQQRDDSRRSEPRRDDRQPRDRFERGEARPRQEGRERRPEGTERPASPAPQNATPVQSAPVQAVKPVSPTVVAAATALSDNPARRHNRRNRRPGSILPPIGGGIDTTGMKGMMPGIPIAPLSQARRAQPLPPKPAAPASKPALPAQKPAQPAREVPARAAVKPSAPAPERKAPAEKPAAPVAPAKDSGKKQAADKPKRTRKPKAEKPADAAGKPAADKPKRAPRKPSTSAKAAAPASADKPVGEPKA